MIVLLPPSEGKAAGGSGRFRPGSGVFGSALGSGRQVVIDTVASEVDAIGVGFWGRSSSELTVRAAEAFELVRAGRAPVVPAWQRYTGVVWTHLGADSLTAARRRSVVVPSGLLGVVTGGDPVPDHRFKLGRRLGSLGRLDVWWRASVTTAIATYADGPVIDLLPDEHAAVIDTATLRASRRVVRVDFMSAGGRGAAGHDAKAVKGVFARALLCDGLRTAGRFEWRGWTCRQVTRDELVVVAPG